MVTTHPDITVKILDDVEHIRHGLPLRPHISLFVMLAVDTGILLSCSASACYLHTTL